MTNKTGRLEDKEVALARLSELKQLVAAGIDSGPGETIDRTALKAEARTRQPSLSTPEIVETSRKRIKLRISERLLADARSLCIDLNAAIDAGLEAAIRAASGLHRLI